MPPSLRFVAWLARLAPLGAFACGSTPSPLVAPTEAAPPVDPRAPTSPPPGARTAVYDEETLLPRRQPPPPPAAPVGLESRPDPERARLAMTRCWRGAVSRDPKLCGPMQVRVELDARGLKSAQLVKGSGPSELAECVGRAFAANMPVDGDVTVVVPVNLVCDAAP